MALLDNCKFNPTAGGTTDWTYSSAVSGYQSPTAASVVSGLTYEVFALDGSGNWEIARGACTVTAGVPTFARTIVLYNSAGTGSISPGQSGAGAKINFASAPTVAVVALSNDFKSYTSVSAVTGTNTTYTQSQDGQLVPRSNSGSNMADTLPGTSPGVLPAGVTINVINSDTSGLLAIKVGSGATLHGDLAPNGMIYIGPGQSVSFFSDGSAYWAKNQPARCRLKGATTIFVSASGSSSNDGLTSSTAQPDPGTAYALCQSAFDINYQSLTISCATGTYPAVLLNGPLLGVNANPTNGCNLTFLGSAGTPTNVVISTTTANNSWLMTNGALATVNGFALSNSFGHNFQCDESSIALIENLAFTLNGGSQNLIISSNGSTVYIIGNLSANSNGGTNPNPGCAFLASFGSIQTFNLSGTITFTLTGAFNFNTGFAVTQYYALIIINTAITFTIVNSVSGHRFVTGPGSTINTAGGGANFFPGSTAGTGSGTLVGNYQ